MRITPNTSFNVVAYSVFMLLCGIPSHQVTATIESKKIEKISVSIDETAEPYIPFSLDDFNVFDKSYELFQQRVDVTPSSDYLHAMKDEEVSESNRKLPDSVFNSETDNGDDAHVVTGTFDAEAISTFSHIVNEQQRNRANMFGRRNSGFTISLNLPVIPRNKDDNKRINDPSSKFSFECEAETGPSNNPSPSSFFKCSQQLEEGYSKEKRNGHDKAHGLIGVNGPYITGLLETESTRYSIISHNIRNDDSGNTVDVSYSYAAARKEDTFYQHIGEKPPAEEQVGEEEYLSEVLTAFAEKGSRHALRNLATSIDANVSNGVVTNPVLSGTRTRKDDDTTRTASRTTTVKRELSDDGSEIDLLIYFTERGACQWLNEAYPCTLDEDAMTLLNSLCDTWVQYMNNVITQSSISSLTFFKVHVAIDETYNEEAAEDWPGTYWVLRHLTIADYGFMDNARSLRDEYSADFIVGFMSWPSGASGRGWVPDKFPERDLGVSISGGSYPFLNLLAVHEVGHNLGCNHHRSQYTNPDPNDYSYGHADCRQEHCWTTVMSYKSVCNNNCTGVEWIPHFSNPNVLYNDVPTGTLENDNARLISESKFGVAINRYRGARMINGRASSSYYSSMQLLVFDVLAKKDITITNAEIFMGGGTGQVELSYSRTPYAGNELNDAFWESVASETLLPLSDINDKLHPIGIFSSPFAITVASGEQVSIRLKMPSGGGFRVSSAPSGSSSGEIANENDNLSLTVGKMGSTSYIYSNDVAMYSDLLYTVNEEPTASPAPSPPPQEEPSTAPSKSPAPSPGTQNVYAKYFDATSWTNLPSESLSTYSGSYKAEFIPTIYFPSTAGTFAGSGLSDNVAAYFLGILQFDEAGVNTLSFRRSGPFKLYWFGNLIYSSTNNLSSGLTFDVTASAGSIARIEIDYLELTGNAEMDVQWSLPSSGGEYSAIPAESWLQLTGVTVSPTPGSTTIPSMTVSSAPSVKASSNPSMTASSNPSMAVSSAPSVKASSAPSVKASSNPSMTASSNPSMTVSSAPSVKASSNPSMTASSNPSMTVSSAPSVKASSAPSVQESSNPSMAVSSNPSVKASSNPSMAASSCSDDTSWRYAGNKKKHCGWVYMSPSRHCSKRSAEGVRASEACPIACGDRRTKNCDIPKCNNDSWYNNVGKSCNDHLRKGVSKCRNLGVTTLGNDTKSFAYEYCSKCSRRGNACVASPTLSPTSTPTLSPTSTPTSTPTFTNVPSPSPSPSPTIDHWCSDDTSWRYDGKSNKNCGWVYFSPEKHCSKLSVDGVPASKACPIACGAKHCWFTPCDDSWINNNGKSCNDYLHQGVSAKGRCRKLGVNTSATYASPGTPMFAYEACPQCAKCNEAP